ncbi:MAG: YjjG family noncanonical pyrimidine nucleotidase [Clostridia bacterium]|nr:YjjG family noncanonical pyrimidine nucleotidase [Clostridia bacterium]
MRKYTTLLFDADETLLDFPAAEKAALGKVCEKFGIEFSEEIRATFSRINLALWKQLEKGLITRDLIRIRRFEQFAEHFGIKADASEMAVYYVECLSTFAILLDGAEELCKTLSENYELYIITNGIGTVQQQRLAKSGLLPYFKGVFISEEVGSQKPQKKFFDHVLTHINEKDKNKICVVGDSMSSDILGGINAGLDTCFFNPWGREEIYTPTYTANGFDALLEIFN